MTRNTQISEKTRNTQITDRNTAFTVYSDEAPAGLESWGFSGRGGRSEKN